MRNSITHSHAVCMGFSFGKTMEEQEKLVTELTRLWMKIIVLDGHKDRDCHFNIVREWSYGKEPVWELQHYGYIGKKIEEQFKTYSEAVNALLNHLRKMLDEQFNWAKNVPINDAENSENAMIILKLEQTYKEIVQKIKE